MNEYKATLKYYGENKPAKLIVHPDSLLLPVDVEFVVTKAGGGRLEFDRPHGEWIDVPRYNRKGKRFLDCSVCHYGEKGEIVCEVAKVPNFCPNCGADMRKKKVKRNDD